MLASSIVVVQFFDVVIHDDVENILVFRVDAYLDQIVVYIIAVIFF